MGELPDSIGEIRSGLPAERLGEVDIGDEVHGFIWMERHFPETKLNVEAEANRRRSIADAEADATKSQAIGAAEAHKSQADADAYAQRAVAAAEAEAITVRADALTDGNQALIAANKLIEILPQLVEAAAKGIAGSNLTVLSGTDGVNQAVAGMVGQGISIYETLRNALVNMPTPSKPEPADGVASAAGKGAALSVARKPEER